MRTVAQRRTALITGSTSDIMVCLTQLTKQFLPGMIGRRFGRILNVGSTGSVAPVPLEAVDAATMGYVLSFSSALAAELQGTGVSVSTLCPGATRTAFARKAGLENTYLFRQFVMESDVVAREGFRGLMRGRRVIIPGVLNRLLVASMPLTPARVLDAVSTALRSPRARRQERAPNEDAPNA